MAFLCVFITGIICVASYIKEKKYYHPTVSFSFLYFLIMLMSMLRLYNYYKADDISYILITVGICCFTLGSFCMSRISFKSNTDAVYVLVRQRYVIMLIVCFILFITRFSVILKFILSGNTIGDVYVTLAGVTDGYDGELAQSGNQALIMQFIGLPLLNVIVPTSIVLFFKTMKKRYICFAVGLAVMLVLLDSRRTYLISCIIFIILAFSIFCFEHKISEVGLRKYIRKIKKWGLLIIIIFALFFYFVTKQRSLTVSDGHVSIGHTFYNYYAGSVQYLGYMLEQYNYEHTYFFTTLRGLFSPIFGVFNILGIESPHSYQVATDIVNSMKYCILNVSPSDKFNSFTTCFYQFYCDGGYVGIVSLSFLFGAYSQYLYNNLKRGMRYEIKYIYFYGVILMLSFTNMRTILMYIVWPLIIERLLYRKISA